MSGEKAVNKIKRNKGHIFISGITQSGKTYFSIHLAKKWEGPVLYFNSNDVNITGLTKANKRSQIEVMQMALNKDRKINYIPDPEPEKAKKEIKTIVNSLLAGQDFSKGKKNDLLVVCDEVHEFDSEVSFIAKRGLGRGIKGCFISQTPADVSKSIVKQCSYHVIFRFNVYDSKYLQSYSIPADELDKKHEQGGKYSFCVFDNQDLYGPYKI